MTPTIASTLAALNNVGNASVTVRLDPQLFPVDIAQEAAARRAGDLSVSTTGDLTVHPTGECAAEALRGFMQDVLAATLQRE